MTDNVRNHVKLDFSRISQLTVALLVLNSALNVTVTEILSAHLVNMDFTSTRLCIYV
jgi:hypothetical protein